MGLDPDELEITIQDSITEGKPITPYPQTLNGMTLVPADINLAAAEMQMISAFAREQKLKNALPPIKDDYDYILIDCPPSLGLLSILGLTAATHLLVPIQCQYKSFKGTELLLTTVAQIKEQLNPELQIAGFVPTMFDGRTAQESRTMQALEENLAQIAPVFPPIPRAIAFADASEEHLPLALYDKKHSAIKILERIAKKIDAIK
jgi:chromosome partitioning protein